MTRLECNLEIIKFFTDYIKKCPDLRFNQALCAFGLDSTRMHTSHTPFFYEESEVTLQLILDSEKEKLEDVK